MKRRDEVLVGILITIAVAVGLTGTVWLARGGLSSGYPLFSVFDWGAGLKQGQPVLLAGVTVGTVSDIELLPAGQVVVQMRIDDDYEVPETAQAFVVPNGFFGDVMIALRPTRPALQYFEPGDTVPSGPPAPTIAEIVARADTMSRALEDVTEAVQVQLVQQGGVRDLRQTIAATGELVSQLNQVVAAQSRELTLTLRAFRGVAQAIDTPSVNATVQNLQQATQNLVALTNNLQQTTQELNVVLAQLQDTTGTAGLLLNDPGLYRDLRSTVSRLDSLTADIKRNPRKYINLEIF